MTDKQIIIDNVDVSGCSLIDICRDCDKNPNCYYKQLKRSEAQCEAMFVTHTDLEKKYKAKEQECEELKKIINEAKNSKLDLNSFFAIEATVGEYQLELDQLKAENEELKKLLKVRIEDLCDSCGASSMMPMPCKVYEKALTEIKTDILDIKEGISYFWVIDKCDEILQKISECEVE